MASLPGENIEVGRYETDFGLRAEAYLNHCEIESAEAGVPVYHAVVEIIDGRGGLDVSIQLLPVRNPDNNAVVPGHYELTDAAKDELRGSAQRVFDQLAVTEVAGEQITPEARIRAMWRTAIEMENSMLNSFMADMFASLKDDEDDNSPTSPLGGFLQ